MASDQMTVAALGRPFTLGMFYDARKDELLPGLVMWDSETLQRITQTNPHQSSEFHVTASDSTEEKSSLLNVEASLKLSFLCGLVEVGGSAKYLNDHKEFKNQSRVTLQYKATTHFEQLSLSSADYKNIQNREIIEQGRATHVVTAILYGADAFFVFDSKKIEESEVQDIEGKMEAVIKKIPKFDIEGKAEIDLNDTEKALVNTFSCEFYGDFILPSNPSTFVSAVQTYVDLPKLLKKNDHENAVPVKVWMLPLTDFEPKAAQLTQGISVGLVLKAENTLDDLTKIQMRCNDYLYDNTVLKFPQLQNSLTTYRKLCMYYTSELQRIMSEKCPAIREGKEDESALRSVFDSRDTSPFSQDKLSKWLTDKEREINVVQSCVQIMEGIVILSTPGEVDHFVLNQGGASMVCCGYIFTSLNENDPFLQEMEKYLDALKMGRSYEIQNQDSRVPWCYNDDIVTNMKQRAQEFFIFKNLYEVHTIFITSQYDSRFPGSATFIYNHDGILIEEHGYPN